MGDRPKRRSEQADSDPLPYVQVDRAVKPKAALLAGALGVTSQHALGSLVEWWDLNGDPRHLAEIVEATPPGEEPAVVITGEAAQERFRLASGKAIEPTTLVHLGLLEPVGDGAFRVRGMSRYFAPVERRLQARSVASKGGKASAESRRRAVGTAQPGSEVSSATASEVGSSAPNRAPKRTRTVPRSDAEAPPNPSGQRSAISDQIIEEDPAASRRIKNPTQAKLLDAPGERPDPRHAPLVRDLVAAFESQRQARYPFTGRDAKAVSNLLATGHEPADLVAAWRRALVATFPKVSTLSEFHASLAHFVGTGSTPSRDWRATQDYSAGWEGANVVNVDEEGETP